MPSWTPSQQNAIDSPRKNLIVSAGAGSGKTTVLTQRILKKLLANEDLTDFLVVTFTKASAFDLREKLHEKLSELIKDHPENKHLRKQLYLLPNAHISTIHSFCLEVVRTNFQTLGISPRVRMADEEETKMIAKDVMETVIDAFYESDNELFGLLADTFSGQKDDGPLSETMWDLYGKLRAYADYFGWLETQANAMLDDAKRMQEGLFATAIGKKLQARLTEWFDDLAQAAERLYTFSSGAFENANPIEIASLWREHANRLKNAVKKDYRTFLQAAEDYRGESFGRLAFGKAASSDKEYFKGERDRIKKEIDRILDSFATGSEAGFAFQCLQTGRVLQAIGLFLSRFEDLFAEAKRDKGVIDFSDAEHFLYKLLVWGGKETALCRSLRNRITEIFIDEYQDVSPLQDELFSLLSRGNNRFMVGDVKQSIYRFRNAYPDIFLGYKDTFADYTEGMQEASARIFLRENFRSGEKILRFVNLLFEKATAGTPYAREYEGEELVFAKQTQAEQLPVTVAVVPHSERSHAAAAETEADYIAEEILRLIEHGIKETKNGTERYRYSDIVLLFRVLKDSTAVYENALKKRGIPYTVTKPEPFFDRPEIMLMMAVLGAIDDPTDDISLFAAMRSPMFGFDANELYQLRMRCRDGSFYRSVMQSAEGGSEKCRDFLEFLQDCRSSAEGKTCHAFLWELYTKSGMLHSCTQKEKKGLMALYEYARSFEQTGFKGLSGFISYLNTAKEKGVELTSSTDGTAGDCVTLTTIHRSKGLEYPAVFVCAAHKQLFAARPSVYTLLRNDGLFFKLRDYDRLVEINTLPNRYAMIAERDAELGEELRKLYVACTRPREKLYITGAVSQKAYDNGNFNPRAPKCLLDIVLSMACGTTSDAFELIEISREEVGFHHAVQKEQRLTEEIPFLTESTKSAILYTYPYKSNLPAKVSVSELKETVSHAEVVYEAARITRAPSFMSEKAAVSPAQRGTANHIFLQFCDFDRVCKDGIEQEIKRLQNTRMMTAEQIALLDKQGLETFFASDLFANMRASKRFYREQRFSVRMPATLFGGSEQETVLLQGVIDCFFENDDGTITVVDYKTDRVTDGAQLRERHALQLQCYRDAVASMTGKTVKNTAIWSFCLNKEV